MISDDYIKKLESQNDSSTNSIKASDLKNKFLYPFFPTMVIDNFYEDPDMWRDYALSQEFFKGERGSWPGLRTELLHTLNRPVFEVTMKKILFVLKDYGITSVSEFQTAFQLIDESYGRGWVHDDDPKLQVAGVIYLNPTAPLGAGTTIYADAPDFNGEKYSKLFMEDVLLSTAEERTKYAKYRQEQVNHFSPTITAESVYNRCILFDSRNWHSADNFFGSTKDDTRLTQVFFIRTA